MIYEHSSYRSFLKEVLAEKTAKNPKYSMRAMAKHLGFATSSLSEVLSGNSGFSIASARRIGLKLGLTPEETEYLCLLVQFESETDGRIKDSLLARMQNMNPRKVRMHDLSVDQFKQISEWYHSALLEMVTGNSPFNASLAAKKLGISKVEVDVAIERLVRLELLERSPEGRLVRAHEHLVVRSNAMRDQALAAFFNQMLQKASDALATQSPKERISGYETLPFSPALIPEAGRIIEKFFTDMVALSRRAPKDEDVYHLTLHLFNLTPRTDL